MHKYHYKILQMETAPKKICKYMQMAEDHGPIWKKAKQVLKEFALLLCDSSLIVNHALLTSSPNPDSQVPEASSNKCWSPSQHASQNGHAASSNRLNESNKLFMYAHVCMQQCSFRWFSECTRFSNSSKCQKPYLLQTPRLVDHGKVASPV